MKIIKNYVDEKYKIPDIKLKVYDPSKGEPVEVAF